MKKVDITLLKKIREQTGISFSDCRRALEQTDNDFQEALLYLQKRGIEKAEKKAQRETMQGLVEAYIHQTGRVGAMVELLCETDFVARTEDFKKLSKELAMQIAAMNPKDVETLLQQEYIRDSSKTVETLIKETIAKLGENIQVKRFKRLEIGRE